MVHCKPSIVTDLQARGVHFVEIPKLEPQLITAVADGFKILIETNPPEKLVRLTVDRSGGVDPDDGLIYRRIEDGHDNKWFFHFRPQLPHWWQVQGVSNAEITSLLLSSERWLSACQSIYTAVIDQARSYMEQLDEVFPNGNWTQRFLEPAATKQHVLRLLYYPPQLQPAIRAQEHTDRDCLTFALYQSTSGLCDVHETSISAPPGHAIVFAGQKAARMSGGHIPALEHCVRTIGNTFTEPRISVVMFIHTDIALTP